MSIELPNEFKKLQSFLIQNVGMTAACTEISKAFGNVCILLEGNGILLRLVKDRGQWRVELTSEKTPDIWYDSLILREILTGIISDESLSLEEELQLFTKNWETITKLFSSGCLENTKITLQNLMNSRAKRMFPKWYS